MTQANTAFSLDDLDLATPSNEGFEIELIPPATNEPLGMFVKVLGKYSNVFIEKNKRASNEYMRRVQQLKKRGKEEEPYTIEKAEERGTDLLVACTIGWRTGDKQTLNFNGADQPFSPANAALLYASPKWAWLRVQVDDGIGDIGNFMTS